MLKHIRCFLFFAALPIMAQTPVQERSICVSQACFYATTSLTLASSAATTLTIQQPATGARQVTFNAAIVQCGGQTFTVDQAQNGAGATTTAGTAVALLPVQYSSAGPAITAAAKVFTASNVGGGTAVAPTLSFGAGDPRVIDLSQRTVGLSGITNNYSITLTNTGGSSCTGTISIYWSEKF